MLAGIRDNLKSSVAASAAPYGYTLTIWGSGAVATGRVGNPGVFEGLLLVAGAVAGFMTVEALAYGSLRMQPSEGDPPQIAIWGNAHVLSAGGGIFLVWVLLQAVDTRVGWFLAGLVATVTYLVGNAIQTTLSVARE